jgi:hypothetical protein
MAPAMCHNSASLWMNSPISWYLRAESPYTEAFHGRQILHILGLIREWVLLIFSITQELSRVYEPIYNYSPGCSVIACKPNLEGPCAETYVAKTYFLKSCDTVLSSW